MPIDGSLIHSAIAADVCTESRLRSNSVVCQACIHELHVPDYRDEQGSCISAAELKDVLLVSLALLYLSVRCWKISILVGLNDLRAARREPLIWRAFLA